MRKGLYIFALVVAVWLTGCGVGNDREGGYEGPESAVDDFSDLISRAVQTPGPSVRPPHIPESITKHSQRTAYYAEHYWDNLDFKNTSLSLDTAYMVRSFAHFADVLAVTATDKIRKRAVGNYLKAADASGDEIGEFAKEVADRCLYDPQSPLYNEESYLSFLVNYSQNGDSAAQDRMKLLRKNRPGTKAADIKLTDSGGLRTTLHEQIGRDKTLLYFYEPGCEICRQSWARLAEDPRVSDAIANRKLKIILVTPGNQSANNDWIPDDIPPEWIVCYDAHNAIGKDDAYIIRKMPSIYLIDKRGFVIAKNISPTQLTAKLFN